MTKHTPGPLEVIQASKVCNVQKEDCLIYHRDEKGVALHIAETYQYQNSDHNIADGSSIANARLIAASYNSYDKHCKNPIKCAGGDLLGELLETLIMMRDADEDCKKDGLARIPDAARRKIDQAIARAEGL